MTDGATPYAGPERRQDTFTRLALLEQRMQQSEQAVIKLIDKMDRLIDQMATRERQARTMILTVIGSITAQCAALALVQLFLHH